MMAWTVFSDVSRQEFRRRLPFDAATWARTRGWALWKALVTVVRERERGDDPMVAARRFGWRRTAGEVVDLVLADDRRST